MELQAVTRSERRKKVDHIRTKGFIPGVVYGHGIKNQHLTLQSLFFEKVYKKAGENTLIDLSIDAQKPIKVLIHDVQFHPISGKYFHVDFYQVRMDEKIKTHVPLKFVGEAPAVKEVGAIIVKAKDELEVECLPQDLVHEIEVDISFLKKIDDNLRIKDIKASKKIKILDNLEDTIVSAAAPRTEEELASLSKTITEDVEKVEVAGEKKKEESEEGEEAEGEKKQKPATSNKKEK